MADQNFRVRRGLTVANSTFSANLDPISLVMTGLTANSIGVFSTGVVNAASHTSVNFIANTTGVYHALVNAATLSVGTAVVSNSSGVTTTGSYTIGANFIANTTGVYHTGVVSGGTINTASYASPGFVANSLGVYANSVVNAASHTVGATFTANATLVNAAAVNVTGQINSATHFCTTTCNVGTLQINTTALIIGTGIVNASNYNATANNALNLGGVAAASYALTSALSAYQTTAGLSASVATLTANNATNLGGVAAAGYLLAATADQTITGGARITVLDLGSFGAASTVTPDPGDRPMQKYTNAGAHTLAPGTNNGNYLLDIICTTGAGTVTTSGWSKVSGDSLVSPATTNKFRCHASITADASLLSVTKII